MLWFVILIVSISISNGDDVETVKTKYICPNNFLPIGNKCYHFSEKKVMWLDSHFYCQLMNSTLSVINSYQEQNLLRNYINNSVLGRDERWIDGIYDWEQRKWKWGSTGNYITFNTFSVKNRGEENKWKCIVINPAKRNKWRATKCTEKRRFICETSTNTYIQFKLYKKKRKKFNIAKCTSGEKLNKYQKRKCLKLLGTVESNEPAAYVRSPKPTRATLDVDKFVCASHMVNLGNRCYSFSKKKATWFDAYYDCRKNNSKLAVVRNKSQNHNLRMFLNNFIEKHDRWIGGRYDWKSVQWKWAMSGQPLKYRGFARDVLDNRTSEDLSWNAIFMDPTLDNQWNVAAGTQQKYYICQVKAKAVKKLSNPKLKSPQATITIAKQNA